MAVSRIVSFMTLASAAVASPLNRRNDTQYGEGKGIQWGECDFVSLGNAPIECANLTVPLDYTKPVTNETVQLSLVRVPATKKESQGSILFNFGGPGSEARQSLASMGEKLQNITGGHHDLVAFDPRGTGDTIAFTCTDKDEKALAEAMYPFTPPDGSEAAMGKLWANTGAWSNICEVNDDIGEYVGTAFVARDLMEVVDALDEDGKLRYWGLSYGSALGATVAAMFSDRMDRIVLDGVVNIHNYYNGYSLDMDQPLGVDAAWTAMLEECIEAGEEKCMLAKLGNTALQIQSKLAYAAEGYKTDPVNVDQAVISYHQFLAVSYTLIKTLSNASTMAEILYYLATGENLELVAEFIGSQPLTGAESDALYAIKCSDTVARAKERKEVMPDIEYLLQASNTFGPLFPSTAMLCAQWPFEAKERYDGGFDNIKTPNPVLFVGNTYDPATSIDSAYNMTASFDGSVVVEQKGFGHTSIAQSSSCTEKIIRDYFVDGKTPEKNTECKVDVPVFN